MVTSWVFRLPTKVTFGITSPYLTLGTIGTLPVRYLHPGADPSSPGIISEARNLSYLRVKVEVASLP